MLSPSRLLPDAVICLRLSILLSELRPLRAKSFSLLRAESGSAVRGVRAARLPFSALGVWAVASLLRLAERTLYEENWRSAPARLGMNRSPPGVLFLDLGVRNSTGRRGVRPTEVCAAGVLVEVLPPSVAGVIHAPPPPPPPCWELHLLLVGVLKTVVDRSVSSGEDMTKDDASLVQFCSERSDLSPQAQLSGLAGGPLSNFKKYPMRRHRYVNLIGYGYTRMQTMQAHALYLIR